MLHRESVLVKLPPKFYEDHRARGNGETGLIIRESKKRWVVELDSVAYDDLLSDADYYADMAPSAHDGDSFMLGLCNSAWWTREALLSVERPSGPDMDWYEKASDSQKTAYLLIGEVS